jgi:hypothetical protein
VSGSNHCGLYRHGLKVNANSVHFKDWLQQIFMQENKEVIQLSIAICYELLRVRNQNTLSVIEREHLKPNSGQPSSRERIKIHLNELG